MKIAISAPMVVPITSPMAIHWYSTICFCRSVAMTAASIPISPARMPRRAVVGALIHFSARTKHEPANRYTRSVAIAFI